MGTKASRLLIGVILLASARIVLGQDEDGYLGILNANESLIESISNKSGTNTGEFSTDSLLSSVRENAQWETEGPVVVSVNGEVLGQLTTFDASTNSLFNESIYVQVPYTDRCEACIGSMNDRFSTEGPKIYDSQSSELKAEINEDIFNK
jgi:hypothetical protein